MNDDVFVVMTTVITGVRSDDDSMRRMATVRYGLRFRQAVVYRLRSGSGQRRIHTGGGGVEGCSAVHNQEKRPVPAAATPNRSNISWNIGIYVKYLTPIAIMIVARRLLVQQFSTPLANPTNAHQLVGQAKRRATEIRPKAVGGGFFGRFSNFGKCRSEVSGDVISGVAVN